MKELLNRGIVKFTALFVVLCCFVCVFSSCGIIDDIDIGDYGSDSSDDDGTKTESESTNYVKIIDRHHTICIDPGHGFGDIGAESEYIGELTEKDINLTFSLALEKELSDRGYTVFLTHDGETFPMTDMDNGNNTYDFKERTSYANSVGMDYFISIHCNTYEGYDDVQGARVYYSEDSRIPVKEPAKASELLCKSLLKAFPDYREPLSYMTDADNSFYVTHWTEACALLLEIGYLTNEEDARNMLSESWTLTMVEAIADGIDDYYTK